MRDQRGVTYQPRRCACSDDGFGSLCYGGSHFQKFLLGSSDCQCELDEIMMIVSRLG